ncbi:MULTISPECIES: hypothetical protein [Sphingomonadales]|uniref:hypothetical protein n=1 Tax=Sphingomonadales TaxID=204457 RepID=UPI000A61E43D|nr:MULTISPECIES: hypothetical protein [Sphingomonadales]
MAKQGSSAKGAAKSRVKAPIGGGRKSQVLRDAGTGQVLGTRGTMVEAVMAAAERSGLLHEKGGRIGGRVSPALVAQAKAQTGIKTDTDLIEFALASVALEDRFAESFKAVRGTVDPDLKLGF